MQCDRCPSKKKRNDEAGTQGEARVMMETDIGAMLLQTNLTSRMAGSPPKLETDMRKWSPWSLQREPTQLGDDPFLLVNPSPTPPTAGDASLWQLQDPRKKKVKNNTVHRRPLPHALVELCGSVALGGRLGLRMCAGNSILQLGFVS